MGMFLVSEWKNTWPYWKVCQLQRWCSPQLRPLDIACVLPTIFSIYFSPGLLDHIFLFLFGLFRLFLFHLCCRPWIPSLTPVNPGFGAGKKHLLKKCPSAQVIQAVTFQMLTFSPCQKGHKLAVFARYCTYIPCKCSGYLVIRMSLVSACRSYTRPPSDNHSKGRSLEGIAQFYQPFNGPPSSSIIHTAYYIPVKYQATSSHSFQLKVLYHVKNIYSQHVLNTWHADFFTFEGFIFLT